MMDLIVLVYSAIPDSNDIMGLSLSLIINEVLQ